jgi:Spy/CpxP family protein refolding chaperone
MRKLALVVAAATTLGITAFVAAPTQAAATHLGVTQALPAVDSSIVNVQWHRRWESRGRWHRRWESRQRWHNRWRSRRGW